ncbi:MAG: GvpL/GvpF family gas vesicle protein [Candidatus Brocadiia bacterium]
MRHVLYGILRSEADTAGRVADLAAGPQLRLICNGDLGAAVSLLPEAAGPPAPKVHAQIVQALHDVCAVLPMRHGIAFETEADVREILREHDGLFRRTLDDLQGCGEMGVRAICRATAVSPPGAPAAQTALSPARAYLAARQSQYAARDAVCKEAAQLAERIERAFEGLFTRRKAESFLFRERPILSLHFLVRRGETERFRNAFRRLEEGAPEKLLLTGPWPPYNFASSENLIPSHA